MKPREKWSTCINWFDLHFRYILLTMQTRTPSECSKFIFTMSWSHYWIIFSSNEKIRCFCQLSVTTQIRPRLHSNCLSRLVFFLPLYGASKSLFWIPDTNFVLGILNLDYKHNVQLCWPYSTSTIRRFTTRGSSIQKLERLFVSFGRSTRSQQCSKYRWNDSRLGPGQWWHLFCILPGPPISYNKIQSFRNSLFSAGHCHDRQIKSLTVRVFSRYDMPCDSTNFLLGRWSLHKLHWPVLVRILQYSM